MAFLSILVQSSSLYFKIEKFFEIYVLFEKYKSLRKNLLFCTYDRFNQKDR